MDAFMSEEQFRAEEEIPNLESPASVRFSLRTMQAPARRAFNSNVSLATIRGRLIRDLGMNPRHFADRQLFRVRTQERILRLANDYASGVTIDWQFDQEVSREGLEGEVVKYVYTDFPAAVLLNVRSRLEYYMNDPDYQYFLTIKGITSEEGVPREVMVTRPINVSFAQQSMRMMETLITGEYVQEMADTGGSDLELHKLNDLTNAVIVITRAPKQALRPAAGFWKYYLDETFPYDLTAAQIYKKSQKQQMRRHLLATSDGGVECVERGEGYDENPDIFELDCLGFVLASHDLSAEQMKKYFEMSCMSPLPFMPSNKLRLISEELKVNMCFTKYSDKVRGKNNCSRRFYPQNPRDLSTRTIEAFVNVPMIHIGKIEDHYFADDMTRWTKYSAEHFSYFYKMLKEHGREGLVDEIDGETWMRARSLKKRRKARGESDEEYATNTYEGLRVFDEDPSKFISVGELLCILLYGPSGIPSEGEVAEERRRRRIPTKYSDSLMIPMDADDIVMAEQEYEYFKDSYKERNIPRMSDEDWADMVENNSKPAESKGVLVLDEGHFPPEATILSKKDRPWSESRRDGMSEYRIYPQLNRRIKAAGGVLDLCGRTEDWTFQDKFMMKCSMPFYHKAAKETRYINYHVKRHYTVVAYDFEATTDGAAHRPYLASIAYYKAPRTGNYNSTAVSSSSSSSSEESAAAPPPEEEERAFSWRNFNIDNELPETKGAVLVKKSFWGRDCANQMIKFLHGPIFQDVELLMIAHNMGYDLKFLIKTSKSSIEGGLFTSARSTKSAETVLVPSDDESIRVCARHLDTQSLSQMKLALFPKAYGLAVDMKKEIFPYDFYNEEFIDSGETMAPFTEMAKRLPEGQTAAEFAESVASDSDFYEYDAEQARIVGTSDWRVWRVNAKKYAVYYCERDVEILMLGFAKMRKSNYNLQLLSGGPCGLDIKDAVSIPQFATHVLGRNGCFEGVKRFRGTLRDYISRAIVGGRCMLRGNIPTFYRGAVEDFDACSLYPSAMAKMTCPTGSPKQWKAEDNIDLKDPSITQYFITVKITNVGKPREFPLVSVRNEMNGRHFTNKLVGKEVVFDKIQWEDAQEFQKIEGDILCGVYFNSGGNTRIRSVMQFLYEERQKLKRARNDAGQQICKLVMNSAYGRMIMKPIDTMNVFKENEQQILTYATKYNLTTRGVYYYRKDLAMIERIKSIYDHYSMPHLGAGVLSWSKRIMNQVMCLAEDHGCIIFYQDTDSMHLRASDKKKLAEEYDKKYPELGGLLAEDGVPEKLGRFHGDFAPIDGERPISIESVYVGKKMYVDKLIVENRPDISPKFHVRMKGVPTSVVENRARELYIEPTDLYMKLLAGEAITFDLTSTGKAIFDCTKDGTVKRKVKFERKIAMDGEKQDQAIEEWNEFLGRSAYDFENQID